MDIAPHMNPDDVPDNLWLQVSRFVSLFALVKDVFCTERTAVSLPQTYALCLEDSLGQS